MSQQPDKSWGVYDLMGERDEVHIAPVDEKHVFMELFCDCKPKRKDDCQNVIIHNAFDGRHCIEEVNRILAKT